MNFVGLSTLWFMFHIAHSYAEFVPELEKRNISPSIEEAIDDFTKNIYLPESQTPGIGLAVFQKGQVVYTTGFGLGTVEKGIAIGNQTQFLLGSLTKSFTVTVVIKALSERFPQLGESVLDTPIRTLLPEADFTLIDRFRSESTTFRDLLSHRLCTFRDDYQIMTDPFQTTKEIVFRTRYSPEICSFRSQFQYNSQAFVIAGELVATLANSTFPALMRNLLDELGMKNSALVRESDDISRMPLRARPYYVWDNISHPMNPELIKRVRLSNAAGGLFVTPNDMLKYIEFHLNAGKVGGKQVIPEDVMRWHTTPSNLFPAFGYKTKPEQIILNSFAYGLGMWLGSYDGWNYHYHGGSFPPYRTLLSLFPSENIGIFTATNYSPLLVDPTLLHAFIFETLRGAENATAKALSLLQKYEGNLEPGETEVEELLQQRKKANLGKTGNDIVGKYGSGSSGDLEISKRFNPETGRIGLYLNYTKWANGWVETLEGTDYIVRWATDLKQEFYARGSRTAEQYLSISDGILEFLWPVPGRMLSLGKFQLGVSLRDLPPIPWSKCDQETRQK